MSPQRDWPARVVLATGNPGKVADLRALLAPLGTSVELRDLPEPVEDAEDYAGNALIKARAAAAASGLPCLGDDAGLEVDVWDGAPGLHTRRWADGLGGWQAAKEALAAIAGEAGTFRCALALCWPDGVAWIAQGSVRGRLVPATVEGPGLEPCFVADGTDRPLPALAPALSAQVHYRSRALAMLRDPERRIVTGSDP